MYVKRILALVITALAAAIVVPSASAAQGTIGAYRASEVTCYTGGASTRIIVSVPHMKAVDLGNLQNTGGGYVFTVGPNHFQWVAYQAVLHRWTGSAWVATASGPWMAAYVANDQLEMPDSWYNYSARGYTSGATTFPISASGYYRVAVQLYWFASDRVGYGYEYVWANSHLDFNNPIYQQWCRF